MSSPIDLHRIERGDITMSRIRKLRLAIKLIVGALIFIAVIVWMKYVYQVFFVLLTRFGP
jgi:hypothetical protein